MRKGSKLCFSVVPTLVAGDYLSIPLFIRDSLEAASEVACKVILQSVAT